MKQRISLNTEGVHPSTRRFILLWKDRKGYGTTPYLSVGECIELLIGITYNLHQEDTLFDSNISTFFNKVLRNEESVVAWEGDELIDILFYEVNRCVVKRLSLSRNFKE